MDNRSVYEIVVICGGIFESNSRDQNELQCRLGEGGLCYIKCSVEKWWKNKPNAKELRKLIKDYQLLK